MDAVDFKLTLIGQLRDSYKVVVTFRHKKTRAYLEALAASDFVSMYMSDHPIYFIQIFQASVIYLHVSVPRFVEGEGRPDMRLPHFDDATRAQNGLQLELNV